MSKLLSPYTPKKIAIVTILGAIILALLKEALSGIIGGGAYDLFKEAWEPIYNSVRTDLLPWIIIVALIIGLFILAFFWWLDKRKLSLTSELATTLNDFDLLLLGLLSFSFSSSQDLDISMKKMVYTALGLAIKAIKNANRAALFLPDGAGILSIWEKHGIPDTSQIKCFGGLLPTGTAQRGVAGEAFNKRKLIVEHIIEKENGILEAETNTYIYTNRVNINGQEIVLPIPYRSLVCVPLIVNDNQEPLGVLCFDSQIQTAFDSQEIKDRLQTIEDRFVPLVSIYQRLKQAYQAAQVAKRTTSTP